MIANISHRPRELRHKKENAFLGYHSNSLQPPPPSASSTTERSPVFSLLLLLLLFFFQTMLNIHSISAPAPASAPLHLFSFYYHFNSSSNSSTWLTARRGSTPIRPLHETLTRPPRCAATTSNSISISIPVPSPIDRPDLTPTNSNPPPLPNSLFNPPKDWRTFARGKWFQDKGSSLDKAQPLPLPMTFPGSAPSSQAMEDMKNCNPETKDCRDVLYQWTGKCSRCQGTGEISSYRKNGKEVICTCITCLGLGYVHKMTTREEIAVNEADDL